ncbi:MAG: DUF115 domain-containing protein, partial [Tannerellaceae bacterium]|nr:DUF115 domain-containing protein [Tannerellaceae bacterium]
FKELSFERIKDVILRRIVDIPHAVAWNCNLDSAKQNKEKLKKYYNIHKGLRCFIMANGPGLKKMDLTLLKNEIIICMNRMYLSCNQNNFTPAYIVVHDKDVQLLQFRDDLEALELPKFFNWNSRKHFTYKENLTYIRSIYHPHFSTDLTKGSWGGHSVTYICIQLAYWMGFSEVYLIGKDHNYEQTGTPGKLMISTGGEKNHFMSSYYKKGMGWRIPDYKGEELAYRMALKAFEKDNRKIYDASIDGKLQIFPKVDYYSLF